MDIKQSIRNLEQFRYGLYQNLDNRADAVMELLDAMCSAPDAKTVVEYSLSPAFRRSYSSLFKAIDGASPPEKWLAEQVDLLRRWP